MKHCVLIAKVFLFNFLLTPVTGQEYLFDAQLLTPEEGLANLMTTALHKDSKGFLWIGTKYGLNRYDGYEFKLFNTENSGLRNERSTYDILEDEQGNLWVIIEQEDYKLTCDIFDPKTQKATTFENYFKETLPFPSNEFYKANYCTNQDQIWVSTIEGMLFFYKNQEFIQIAEQVPILVKHVFFDHEDKLWVVSDTQMICLDQNGQILKSIPFKKNHKLNNFFLSTDGTVWLVFYSIETDLLSLWSIEYEQTELQPFLFMKGGQKAKDYGSIDRDENGFWYITIDDKLQIFNPEGQWLFDYTKLLGKDVNLNIQDLIDIEKDIWVATSSGLLKTSIKKPFFKLIQPSSELSDIRGITEDEKGNIYFLYKGLYEFNPAVPNIIKQVCYAPMTLGLLYHDNSFYTGNHSAEDPFLRFDVKTQQSTNINIPDKMHAYTFLVTKHPQIYLVGWGNGISYLDTKKQRILPFEKYNDLEVLDKISVYHFHKNDEGIWLATSQGIFLMTEEEGVLQHFNRTTGHLPFDHIRHIYEDESGIFWLATAGGGILKWKPVTTIEDTSLGDQFTTKDGLSHDYTYAIYGDQLGYLWIPSDKGLMRLRKKDFKIKTFTTLDGLAHNEFNLTSHYKSKDSLLYFGGLGGIVFFDPKNIPADSTYQSPIQFTSLKIFDEEKKELQDNTKLLAYTDEIMLASSTKMVELEFALLDFKNTEYHRYKYQIEGYDDTWYTINDNKLRLLGLPYGRYTLRIKGQNINKDWSTEQLKLNITIAKPFYLQWWFIILMILSLIGLILFVVQRRELNLKKNQKKLEEEVHRRTQKIKEDKALIEHQAEALKHLDKAKTRFFSNITHEFRTPLTLIIGPTEQLIEHIPPPHMLKKKMSSILKNAQHLLSLINQMLDLSKIEGNQMKVEMTRGDIVLFTRKLVEQFEPLAQKKSQKLNFICNQIHWNTAFDKEKWNKIIYNLIHNALKFTPEKGTIQLFLDRGIDHGVEVIYLKIKDNGIGINSVDLEHIFNRFYQVDSTSTRHQDGTGIGLALVKELVELQGGVIQVSSTLNKGTTFEVTLPVKKIGATNVSNEAVRKPLPLVAQVSEKRITTLTNGKQEKLELLIVEDNEEMREYIHHCIDTSKYNITESVNGEDGILKAKEMVPDLIISDVMMPYKDGFELVKAIRTHITTSHIPIILLTAKTSLESRLEGFKRGADAYLTKPFSPHELVLRIQKLIELRQLLQNRYQGHLPLDETKEFQQEDEFITDLKAFITDNLNDPDLNVLHLCRHFGISRTQFYRKLNALVGRSVAEYIRSIRLETAKQLLSQKRLSIAEVAYSTGFSSPSHFTRTFKKAYGKTPSSY